MNTCSRQKISKATEILNYKIQHAMCACVLSHQLCLTVCNSMDFSLPSSSVHGILQARILEWLSSSRGYSWPRDQTCVSCITGRIFTAEPLGRPKFNRQLIFLQDIISKNKQTNKPRMHILFKCTWSILWDWLGHKTSLNTFKSIQVISSIFSDHNFT